MAPAEPKAILVYGARGAVGRLVVDEARRRGHAVTGVSRSALPCTRETEALVKGDAADGEAVRALSRGFDVVVSATRPAAGREVEHAEAARGLVAGLRGTGRRLVMVGGAATLLVPGAADALVLDDPRYVQDAWRPIARACVEQLAVLEGADELDWTYISPPAFLTDGPRTGTFRRGQARLLVDADGRSAISRRDFAVAVVDEVEAGGRRRVTVAY
ncbi:MAG: NAD(P)-dependent oxidoreductase [Nannocystaceae bacterium]|nr:NAD(P)H-binding protein [bacterium]